MHLQKYALAGASVASMVLLTSADKIEFCNEKIDGRCPYGSNTCTIVDFHMPSGDIKKGIHTERLNIPDNKTKGDMGSCGRVSQTSLNLKKMRVVFHIDETDKHGLLRPTEWELSPGGDSYIIDKTVFTKFQVMVSDIF